MPEITQQKDGNAVGGLLNEIFPFEMTLARTICRNCESEKLVAELTAFVLEMGTVLRCPECDAVLMKITNVNNSYWMDLGGMKSLRISH